MRARRDRNSGCLCRIRRSGRLLVFLLFLKRQQVKHEGSIDCRVSVILLDAPDSRESSKRESARG